ncbi:MAG: cell division protein FtsQ/DivIB [Anaerolineae bacterium]
MKRNKRPRREDAGWQPRDWTYECTTQARRMVRPGLRWARKAPGRGRGGQTYAEVAAVRALRRPLVIPTRTQVKALVPRLPGLLALAFWVWVLLWVSFSDAYYVPQVEVRGNEIVATERLLAQAGVPAGYHIFFVNPLGVRARILELPEVREATVVCQLPGQVVLTVRERTPVYNWRRGEQLLWLDSEGRLLPADLPLPEALTVVEAQEGEAGSAGGEVDVELLRALDQLKGLQPQVREYGYAPASGLSFRTPEGVQVFLGTHNLAEKVRLLQQLLQETKKQGKQPSEVHVEYRYPVVKW